MPLPPTGSISIGQVATEFGRTGPVSFSSLFKTPAAANVPGSLTIIKDIAANAGVPASGAIRLDGFHSSKSYKASVTFATTAETSHQSTTSQWCCCCGNSGYQGWQTVTTTVYDNNGYVTVGSGGLNYSILQITFKGVNTTINLNASTKLVGGKNNTTYPFTLTPIGGIKSHSFCFVPNKGTYAGSTATGTVLTQVSLE